MSQADGRPSGFEYIRIVLAVLILYNHSFVQGTGEESRLWHFFGVGAIIGHILVPMFFAVSGFLVAGSLDRARLLSTFLGLRALRIYPALWCPPTGAAGLVFICSLGAHLVRELCAITRGDFRSSVFFMASHRKARACA
ncbi:MAG: acyltransferase family protein [Pseudorhodoplanes sp.]